MQRIVRPVDVEAMEVAGNSISVYFSGTVPTIGMVIATINGSYPPAPAFWAANELVEEIYFVVDGRGTLIFEDGESAELTAGVGVLIPSKTKYPVTEAEQLRLVAATGPAWTPSQHLAFGNDGELIETEPP